MLHRRALKCIVLPSKGRTKTKNVRDGVSSLGSGQEPVLPAWRDDADLTVLPPSPLGPEISRCACLGGTTALEHAPKATHPLFSTHVRIPDRHKARTWLCECTPNAWGLNSTRPELSTALRSVLGARTWGGGTRGMHIKEHKQTHRHRYTERDRETAKHET